MKLSYDKENNQEKEKSKSTIEGVDNDPTVHKKVIVDEEEDHPKVTSKEIFDPKEPKSPSRILPTLKYGGVAFLVSGAPLATFIYLMKEEFGMIKNDQELYTVVSVAAAVVLFATVFSMIGRACAVKNPVAQTLVPIQTEK